MITLGINAAFHDSAAALVRDGALVAASEEERFTRIKHGKRPVPFSAWELPFNAIDDCLRQAGVTLAEVDHVAYSYDPQRFIGERLPGGDDIHRVGRQGGGFRSAIDAGKIGVIGQQPFPRFAHVAIGFHTENVRAAF